MNNALRISQLAPLRRLVLALALLGLPGAALPGRAQSPNSAPHPEAKEPPAIENSLVGAVIIEGEPPKIYSIEERMKFFQVPGVSVALFEQGKLSWFKSYGYADVDKQVLVTPETRFQAASISKSVTAFAVLRLVAQHRLDLDRDVNEYLTGWKIPATVFTSQEKVTIRRLLNHHAGVTGEGFEGYLKTVPTPTTTTGVLNGDGNTPAVTVAAVPGSRFAYSGGGYVVLQKVLEDVLHQPFAELMQQLVLAPLGMSQSTFNQSPEKNVSLAYDHSGKVCPGGWRVHPELAPAGLWTTPRDLATFSLAVQNAAAAGPAAFLPPALAQAMVTPWQTSRYGLGIMVRGEGATRSVFHAGSNPGGYESLMINYPEKGVGIVIMTNGSNGRGLRDEIFRAFSSHYGLPGSEPLQVRTIELGKDELARFTGQYKFEKKGNYFLKMSLNQNNQLVLFDASDGKTNVFVATGANSFVDVTSGEKAVFTRHPTTGKILGMRYNGAYDFTKVEE